MKSKSSAIPSSNDRNTKFDELIKHYHTDGYWNKTVLDVLKSFIGGNTISDPTVEELFKNITIQVNGVDQHCVYLTLVALYILKEEFDDREDEWQSIAKKAENFLKKAGITKPDTLVNSFSLKLKV